MYYKQVYQINIQWGIGDDSKNDLTIKKKTLASIQA